ncbi:MAG: replication initiation factor domain-containing protein [Ruthenibacterium sp.]
MAQKIEVKILVDYLCFTVRLLDFMQGHQSDGWLRDFIEMAFHLGSGSVDFECKKAFYGYSVSYSRNGITYCFGGRDDIYIQMSGSGCRYWETLNPGKDWISYIIRMRESFSTLHFSRLDIAGDAFNLLDIRKIQVAATKQQYVSRWKRYLVCAGNAENYVLFGSPTSDFRLRIYDKTEERTQAGCKEVPENWVRCEFQMRNDAAKSFIDSWCKMGDIGDTYCGIMRNQLRFWSVFDGVHYDRMKLKSWWQQFLGNGERIKMAYQGGLEYNLEAVERYVYHQAGSSIRTLIEAKQGDISQLLHVVKNAKLNDLQKELLANAVHVDLPM